MLAVWQPVLAQVESISFKRERSFHAAAGSSECQNLRIENTSADPFTMSSLFLKTSADFELRDSIEFPYTLSPGESVNLGQLCFHPAKAGEKVSGKLILGTQIAGEIAIRLEGTSDEVIKQMSTPSAAVKKDSARSPHSDKGH